MQEKDAPTQCHVTLLSRQGRQECMVRRGLGFQALALRQDTALEFDCRKADCGICLVEVVSDPAALSPPTAREKDYLAAMRAEPQERLACQCRILADVTVRIPDP